ncbi:class I SAM-dependent methyltransferase [Paenibacillus roseipurpureus]|uniref:Class I SAM-dependent methyltransferase n=1 Tax=Paenibacillus roseopurpureus TaxID=2918901 RepID=A0AA96LUI8_9BACL|nr:class I SAM-dependent methyltransferase [Paenibacillus sp. MBLB1832]WNR46273.1 class I SAM-dependent methyltransferase [Paenibacillus sp. MBLB1832]
MNRFMEKVIKPILVKYEPAHIVEIGVYLSGRTTIKLLEFCKMMNSKLTVIDPAPGFDTNAYKAVFSDEVDIHRKHSLEVLPEIQAAHLYVIDGDHNWYTVYHELMAIEQSAIRKGTFPIVILHDTEWPYGRRDSYYFPEAIPAQYQHRYAKKGILAESNELVESGGINADQCNAWNEYGDKNGVLTAIEDFLKVTSFPITFHRLYTNNGLGILFPSDEKMETVISYIIDSSGL